MFVCLGVIPKKPDIPTVKDTVWQSACLLSTMYEHFELLPDDMLNIIPINIGDWYHVREQFVLV